MIEEYGWDPSLAQDFASLNDATLIPGRVIAQQRGQVGVITDHGEIQADFAGRIAYVSNNRITPVIGDWVACAPRFDEHRGTIQAVLPRRTTFVRKEAGTRARAQVIAANVDITGLVMTMTADFNLPRLERYYVLAVESGATPLLILTKADLCAEPDTIIAAVKARLPNLDVIIVSAATGQGMAALAQHFTAGRTAILLGSSGAGKSTLVNALAGSEIALTGGIRLHDEKGRHTTTHRELMRLPNGTLLIDTPGMREIGLIDAEAGLAAAFDDVTEQIDALATECRFRNCTHQTEPDCAVRAALEDGRIDPERWANWAKLKDEMAHVKQKDDPAAKQTTRAERVRLTHQSRKRK